MRLYLKRRFRLTSVLCSPVTKREIVFYCLLVALLFGQKVVVNGGPLLGNDSYQYLSVAQNLLAGNGPQTSLINFDTERSWHQVPASLTTFPPGYPAAIGFFHLAGTTLTTAGFLISVLAGISLVPLMYWACWLLNYDVLVTRLLLFALIGNAWYAFYSASVMTEALFTLVSTAAVLTLVTGLSKKDNDRQQVAWIVTAHLLIGLAYWIRYAGLFLFCSACLHFLLFLGRQRDVLTWRALGGLGISGGLIGIAMVRNFLYVGTWKGGNDKVVTHPWFDVFQNFLLQFHHLFMGGTAQPRLWLVDMLFLVAALVTAGLASRSIWSTAHSLLLNTSARAESLLIIYIIVYCGGLLYLSRTSVIDVTTRMFYPLLPCLLLATASLFLMPLTRRCQISTVTFMLLTLGSLYLLNNGYHYLAPATIAPHQLIAEHLGSKSNTKLNLMAWTQQNVPPEATIVANEGQAVGFLLQRNTVGLVSDRYGSDLSEEADVRTAMLAYRANFLFLIKERDENYDFVKKSRFLSGLTQGRIPAWLELAAQNTEVIIFRRIQS